MNAYLKIEPPRAELPSIHSSAGASRERLVATLRGLLRASFELRHEGASYARLAHAQGYADGFMRCLIDGGIMSATELLDIVTEVRRGVCGPATATVEPEPAGTTAA